MAKHLLEAKFRKTHAGSGPFRSSVLPGVINNFEGEVELQLAPLKKGD